VGAQSDMADIGNGLFASEFTISTLPVISDTGYYFAKLTDGSQIISSTTAPFFVGEPLTVVSEPQGGAFHVGASHDPMFSVGVAGGVGGVTYSWSRNGQTLPASSSTYNLTPLAAYDTGTYQVSVRDVGVGDGPLYALTPTYAGPNGVYVSPEVQLAVSPVLFLLPAGQPKHQTGHVGTNYAFSVSPTGGAAPLQYQWFRKVSLTGTDMLVGTSQNFPVWNAQPSDQGLYYCIIKDQLGGTGGALTSTTARLTLIGTDGPTALSLLVQPKSVSVKEGDKLILSVLAGGGTNTDYTFSWTKDGQVIPGADEGALVISPVAAADKGVYKATVCSGADCVVSAPATVTVEGPVPLAGGLGLLTLAAMTALGGIASIRRRRQN